MFHGFAELRTLLSARSELLITRTQNLYFCLSRTYEKDKSALNCRCGINKLSGVAEGTARVQQT